MEYIEILIELLIFGSLFFALIVIYSQILKRVKLPADSIYARTGFQEDLTEEENAIIRSEVKKVQKRKPHVRY